MPRCWHAGSPVTGFPHLFVATPAITLHPNYVFSLAESLPRLMNAGIAVDYCLLTEDCHVDDARNALVTEFLETECTDLLFIDADVGWNVDDLIRLCGHLRDVVGGSYPQKDPNEEKYPIQMKPGIEIWADREGLVECDGLPTGFLKIRRWVIETLVADKATKRFWGQTQDRLAEKPHPILFERTYADGARMSGDYAFCAKVKRMGARIFVDPAMRFSHEGPMMFSGTLGNHWKRVSGIAEREMEQDFDAAVVKLRGGTADAETLQALYDGWGNRAAASIELLATLHDLAKQAEGPILECGSGLSSLVMALANPRIEVHAFENDAAWAAKLNHAIARLGVANVRVHWFPLRDYPGGRWYDFNETGPDSYAVVFIDGPWRAQGARGVAFQALGPRMDNAVVVADDAHQEHEPYQVLRDWAAAHGRVAPQLFGTKPFAVSAPVAKAALSGAA